MRYEYVCTRCGVESHVELPNGASVYEGCNAIADDHTELSPECMGDLSTIRLTGTPPQLTIDREAMKASE